MWPVSYSKSEEAWIVGEFDRSLPEDKNNFFWRDEAEHWCVVRNARLRDAIQSHLVDGWDFRPTTDAARKYTEYDLDEASDVWPGGMVSYGVSYG